MSEYICPHCKQSIYDDDALLCHFCGESLRRTSKDALGKMSGAGWKWVWVSLVLLVIASFVMMFAR